MRALAMMLPGSQEGRAKGLQTLPTRSWIMKRPTRVPASTVVKMNRASNMMAKWYQNACRPAPRKAVTWAKIEDITTARVGAPPVRPTMDSSPTALAVCWSVSGETWKPKPLTAWEEIGRASCRERVQISAVAVSLKKKGRWRDTIDLSYIVS